jgi:hypothetical protein
MGTCEWNAFDEGDVVVRIGIISAELQKLVVKSAEPAFFEPATAVERTAARSTFSAPYDPPRADAVSGAPTRAVPASFDKSFHLTSFDLRGSSKVYPPSSAPNGMV